MLSESRAFSFQRSLSILQGCLHGVSRLRIVEAVSIALCFDFFLEQGFTCISGAVLLSTEFMVYNGCCLEWMASAHLLEVAVQRQQIGIIISRHPFVNSGGIIGPSRVQRSSSSWVVVRRR